MGVACSDETKASEADDEKATHLDGWKCLVEKIRGLIKDKRVYGREKEWLWKTDGLFLVRVVLERRGGFVCRAR